MNFSHKTVLITGGASGIGKIMGRKALERGASKLIIWDINRQGLEDTKRQFETLPGEVLIYKVDISNLHDILNTVAQLQETVTHIDVLINNAGIVVGKYFHEHSHVDITQSMAINADAMLHITLAFLPGMMDRNAGSICNICSSAGLISNPKMSVYAASKWAAVGWSDTLRLEMKQLKKDIKISTIMPFYINTGMFDGVKSKILPILQAEPASERIIRAMEKETKMLAIPLPYWFIRLSQGILPLLIFDWVMQNVLGVYDGMKGFKGRN